MLLVQKTHILTSVLLRSYHQEVFQFFTRNENKIYAMNYPIFTAAKDDDLFAVDDEDHEFLESSTVRRVIEYEYLDEFTESVIKSNRKDDQSATSEPNIPYYEPTTSTSKSSTYSSKCQATEIKSHIVYHPFCKLKPHILSFDFQTRLSKYQPRRK